LRTLIPGDASKDSNRLEAFDAILPAQITDVHGAELLGVYSIWNDIRRKAALCQPLLVKVTPYNQAVANPERDEFQRFGERQANWSAAQRTRQREDRIAGIDNNFAPGNRAVQACREHSGVTHVEYVANTWPDAS